VIFFGINGRTIYQSHGIFQDNQYLKQGVLALQLPHSKSCGCLNKVHILFFKYQIEIKTKEMTYVH
jgi:hypothetical protein